MLLAFLVPSILMVSYIVAIGFMYKVPPDADKGPFNPRPGLAAELAAHRTKKRKKREKNEN